MSLEVKWIENPVRKAISALKTRKTNSPFYEAAKLLVFTVATSGRRCGIMLIIPRIEHFTSGSCPPRSLMLDRTSHPKLNTSSFMATELTIFKTAKTQSSSQSTGPKFVRAIKYRIVHFTIHRSTPSEGDFQI